MNVLHLGSAGIQALEYPYGKAGRLLGSHLLAHPQGTIHQLPAGMDPEEWSKAYRVLFVSIALAADIKRLAIDMADRPNERPGHRL